MLKVICAISLIMVAEGPQGSFEVACGSVSSVLTILATSSHTLSHLDLGTGVTLGHIFDASHNPRHDGVGGALEADEWQKGKARLESKGAASGVRAEDAKLMWMICRAR